MKLDGLRARPQPCHNRLQPLRYAFLFNQPPNPQGPHGLRVGLTGGLGSGKSTAAAMLAAHGAIVFSADDLARSLMQPGQPVFAAIVEQFGPEIVRSDGSLDRAALARAAFTGGRVEELNAIIHPATIALQAELTASVFARQPNAIVVIESALIFETRFTEDSLGKPATWPARFDRILLVTASEDQKIARFIERSGATQDPAARDLLAAEARRRLAHMIPDAAKAERCDFILSNDGSLEHLQQQVDAVWQALTRPQP